MQAEAVLETLADSARTRQWLQSLGVEDASRGGDNLRSICRSGIPPDLVVVLCTQLSESLKATSDPDAALNNLERFVGACRSPLALVALFERDSEALPSLLQIFSTSQYLADLLVRDPEGFDLLRLTEGQPVAKAILADELNAEVDAAADEGQVARILRSFKQRETLRIAYGDFVRDLPLSRVTEQISSLADVIVDAAVRAGRRRLAESRGIPRRPDGSPARFSVLALGKLGGSELNYSSDIDLIFLHDPAGSTDGRRPVGAAEFFERLARAVIKLLAETTDTGAAYRVDMRLRPLGAEGPLVTDLVAARRYYDVMGRTWERQAFVKARPIAGDLDLGQEFLDQLQPWIYRRFLTGADIAGIQALKRKIEKRALQSGDDQRNVKTGHGGIRDIEFAIQFLQLLNGSDLLEVRTGNTLRAIAALEQVGCLTMQERSLLTENYIFLRRIEHHLQIMLDLQTHTVSDRPREIGQLAWRLGYRDGDRPDAEGFQRELSERQGLNRRILDHLLHDAFGGPEKVPLETELVLDPEPDREQALELLRARRFRDPEQALRRLGELAQERIPFLSTRRCRHFLAAIAPHLLDELARTPDPDAALVSLVQVADSLGGKGVLWELFSFTPPTLRMFVRLCACSPYLVGILTSNPGMIDELMDALVLDRLPSTEEIEASATELCRGAEDIGPILRSFKNSIHLQVGVRDILNKEDIPSTHRALSDTAEAILRRVVDYQHERLAARYGDPTDEEGNPAPMSILALGKLGAREPNYHSDLDVIFLYAADGQTRPRDASRRRDGTTNNHFYNQLAQRVIKYVNELSPQGRLYEIDARLRPSGRTGILAVPNEQLRRYFASGEGQLWERLALCKGRPVYGDDATRAATMAAVREIICDVPWSPDMPREIRAMRMRMQESASPKNLKRGEGGTVDVEFIVQMLQLKHAGDDPEVVQPGTLDGIDALARRGYLDGQAAADLKSGYQFLRSIESGLRLLNTNARHDFPTDPEEFRQLAFLLEQPTEPLQQRCDAVRRRNRELFDQIFAQASEGAQVGP